MDDDDSRLLRVEWELDAPEGPYEIELDLAEIDLDRGLRARELLGALDDEVEEAFRCLVTPRITNRGELARRVLEYVATEEAGRIPAPEWTREIPEEPGWYWTTRPGDASPRPVEVA